MSDAPARAMPKSVTFARPSSSTMTFWGLKSRWMTPRRWAKRAARRIWIVRSAASAGSSGPCSRTSCFSVRPATYSIAMYGRAVGLAAVVDRDDVLVLQPRRRRGLAAEALDELLVAGEAVVQELQRDLALELQVVRAVHLRHAAGPDVLEDLVAAVDHGVRRDARHFSSSCMTAFAIGAATTPPWLCGPCTRSIVTATATFGLLTRREADEPRLVDRLRDVQLGGARLAGHLDALERGGDAGPLAHDVGHHLPPAVAALSALMTRSASAGSIRSHRAPVLVDDPVDEVRLHAHAAVGDRRRDRRHLQRRHEQALLADTDAADVDAAGVRRDDLVALDVEDAARAHLAVGIVHRRVGVEAEARHVVRHRLATELLGDLRPDRVDGVRQRVGQRDRAELLVGEVRQRRAGDDDRRLAVDERVRRELAAVERRRRRDDLHRRAGR